ncbi:RCC1 domain-containing protein [Archangium violaceum]|uniref:RCC1 domain-containing protein n=1 Tax=Archangium violaceum TaxID=83451 RepID=UPI0037BFE1EF
MRLLLAISLGVWSGQALAGEARGHAGRAGDVARRRVIAAGLQHSLAVDPDGDVWAWGTNDNGQLGALPDSTYYTPTQVPGISDVVAVSAGSSFSLALRRDGTVWAWGLNNTQQLGDGTTTQRNTALQVPGLMSLKAVSTPAPAWGAH